MTTHAHIKPYSGRVRYSYNHLQTYKCEPLDRADPGAERRQMAGHVFVC